jgi:hypothetical protein
MLPADLCADDALFCCSEAVLAERELLLRAASPMRCPGGVRLRGSGAAAERPPLHRGV